MQHDSFSTRLRGRIQQLASALSSFFNFCIFQAAEGVIVVSFALNEPGTAYCRATRCGFAARRNHRARFCHRKNMVYHTVYQGLSLYLNVLCAFSLLSKRVCESLETRSDSGETPADMQINRVLAAAWSAEHAGPPNSPATITMTQIRSVVPLETLPVPIEGSTQYDVYCWAKAGFAQTLMTVAAGVLFMIEMAPFCHGRPWRTMLRPQLDLTDRTTCHRNI